MTLLPLLLATAASAGLSLDVSSPQHTVFVGEPVKLVVRWKADEDLQRVFIERGRFQDSSVSFSVDDGLQLKTYRELTHDTSDVYFRRHGMKKGTVAVTNLVLVHGRYEGESPRGREGFLFRAPGTYGVKAIYTDPHGGVSATSSAVRFTVTEPSDKDREILEAAMAQPMLLGPLGLAVSPAKLIELIKTHPRSPYLRFMRLRLLESRFGHPHRAEHFQKIADEVFAEAEWGPFEEEALALAMKAARAAGDTNKENRARDELLRKHPDSATVSKIKDEAAQSARFKEMLEKAATSRSRASPER